jgi:hypothetical protein
MTASVDEKMPAINSPISEVPRHVEESSKQMWRAAFTRGEAGFWFIPVVLGVQLLTVNIFTQIDIPNHHKEEGRTKKSYVRARIARN